MFMILINLAALIGFWWLIARLLLQTGTVITDKVKHESAKHSPPGFCFRIQDHPILNDVSKAISNAPYGCAHSLIVNRRGVTVHLWNDGYTTHSQTFLFSSYGTHDLTRDSELNIFTTALRNRIPWGNQYKLVNHMMEDDLYEDTFHLDYVAFEPNSNLPIPALMNRALENDRRTRI